MTKKIFDYLVKNSLTISSVESFTGGLFSTSMVNNPGSSKVFVGALVSYSIFSKIDVLGINKEVLNEYGTISQETSLIMALKGKEMFKSDIVISFTGNSGPNPIEGKPVGLFFISVVWNEIEMTIKYDVSDKKLTREEIRNIGVEEANEILLKLLNI